MFAMKELQQLIARIVARLDAKGDQPFTAADLANILEQEMRQVELDAELPAINHEIHGTREVTGCRG